MYQITTSWMEEGLQQGLRQGGQEGREKIVLRQLTHRFGSLSESVEARIHVLSTVELEDLADALLDFKEPEDMNRWLAQQEAAQAE